jgi:hypothetical protein
MAGLPGIGQCGFFYCQKPHLRIIHRFFSLERRETMNKRLIVLCAALMVMWVAAPVFGAPIVVGDPLWYEFTWSAVNTDAVGGGVPSSAGNSQAAPGNPWTFSSATPVQLTVTDAFLEGDAFNIFNFGSLLGSTPAVANTGNASFTSDPVVALTIPELSHAVFDLAAGSYSLTVQAYQQAAGTAGGAGFFRADAAAVPVPPTVFLLGGGLLSLFGWRLRKQ